MSRDIQDVSTALEGMVGGLGAEPRFGHFPSHAGVGLRLARRAYRHVGRGTCRGRRNPRDAARWREHRRPSVGRDPSTAIALLKVERPDLQPVAMAGDHTRRRARSSLAVGAESGAPTAALGLVSVSRGPWQSMRGGEIDARIELDMRLRSTAEGGLAVNAAGQAFGMTVFGPRRRVLVIPSVTISRVAARLETHGRIPRGYLGLGLQPVTIEGGGAGVMVMSVDPKGPGAAANIHQGDVLVSWDGKPIGKLQPLLRSLGPDSVGKLRGDRTAAEAARSHQTRLQIGERPAA